MGLSLGMCQTFQLRQTVRLEDCYSTKHRAICPDCNHKLSRKEVEDGFSSSIYDFTTACPKCGRRFLSELRVYKVDEETGKKTFLNQVHLMCPVQTLNHLLQLKMSNKRVGQKFLIKNYPTTYFSLLWNFKTYASAMRAMKETCHE